MRQNILWLLFGGVMGMPLALYAVGQQRQQAVEVHYEPELFAQYATSQDTAGDETEQVTEWEIYEPTPEEREEELYYDSLELLATLVYVEAGNQDMQGKRYVVDVVLNRVDSVDFPDNITDVIFQENAFSTVSSGAFEKALCGDMFVNDMEIAAYEESLTAVRLELEQRTDDDILYFTADGYSRYGTPAYRYGGHYFSTQ